ncbi:MAG: glucose PTS transporter subunit IIA, partial [Candidatus Riflebacteria bacterium]|nr:glucose PTS transporter subunit IIA [Candidatus Riflebacteria bacterium]
MSAKVSAERLEVMAPLSGFLMALETVPDPVFAQKLVGDGVSIDPVSNVLKAPVAGEIIQIHSSSHALTVKTPHGIEILIHIGLDTVKLGGKGFEPLVKKGDNVTLGQDLIRFDADFVATNARSLLTQVVVTNPESISELLRETGSVDACSDVIFTVIPAAAPARVEQSGNSQRIISDSFVVVNPSGLHARPASVLAGLARQFECELHLQKGD